MKHQTELDERYAWQRKGKKYRTKYFTALGQLFGDGIKANSEAKVKRSGKDICQEEST